MDFNDFSQQLVKIKNLPLPGTPSHNKMAPEIRIRELREGFNPGRPPRKAGVMAIFYPRHHQTYFLLIHRKTYEGVHSNQVGFPGGKAENQDKDLLETALRETFEEVGVRPGEIEVIRPISKIYIPPSNFEVQPFLGICQNALPFVVQEDEVEALVEIALPDLMDDKNLVTQILSTSYAKNIEVPAFRLNGHIVWGATGMMLNEIREIFKQVL